ncbi:septin-7 isoform X12 [Hermetia illucens]|uniref:septin-7 isoform X12 n=1 Tax=Hermetia illucens TaxID=343691 RepID=UPI0018CC463A|nr:septin-7 isoform X12 [Hermetia illucens]
MSAPISATQPPASATTPPGSVGGGIGSGTNSSTNNSNSTTTNGNVGSAPPIPPAKPILSSPGSYKQNFINSANINLSSSGTTGTVTAGIHSVNKAHSTSEKPAIAARPIPPPTLPKYSTSFGKIDRDRNEFGKIDRAEREKIQSKREMFFKSDTHSPPGPPPNPPTLNHINSNSTQNNSSTNSTPTANDKHHIALNNNSTPQNHTTSTQLNSTNTTSSSATPNSNVNNLANNINNMSLKEKQQQLLENNGHSDSNKIAIDRYDKEKQQAVVRPKPKELDGYVGFANLPNQVYRKAVKKGFEFTLMVVGESGLGKSTLINSMFLSDIYNQDQHPGPSHRVKKTVAVETTKVLLKENGVNLTLTVVDTPGFGDAVDNSNCWVPIIDFVESKYEEYLTAESRVHRIAIPDNRVHSCLYFIAPSGHGLKPLDVEFMSRLCDKVNIIPVIAKADTMTPEEVQLFKKQILNEIAQHKIKIYDFPEPLEDEEEAKVLRQLRHRVPFAIVGANTVIEVEGRKVRGRRYPWGIAEVENLEHCDFIALRNMVIRTHLQDLKDVTNNVHYENYRCRKLAGLGNDGKTRLSNKNPLAQMEEEKREHELKMKKMEAEMEQVFEMKVKEKKQKLKDSELELTRRHEERKKALEIQIRELEDRRRAFEQEKKEWEDSNGITLDELRRRSLEANSKETASMTSRSSDESKGRRVFGSLLRRHTSFGAPDTHRGSTVTANNTNNTTTSNTQDQND